MGKKQDIGEFIDIPSLVDSYKIIVNDGTNGNGAISPETLRKLATDILDFVPSDVTFGDIGLRVDTTGGWANWIISLRRNVRGDFKKTGDTADTKGVITVGGESTSIQVFGYEAKSSFDITNLEQARIEGRNILNELHQAHTIKYFEKVDELVYKGLFDSDLERDDSAKTWDTMDDNEKLTAIYNLLKAQRAGKSRKFWADTLIVDDGMFQDISTTDYSTLKEGTIAEKISKTFGVNIVSSWRLIGYGTGTDKRVIGAVSSADWAIRNRIPIRLKISPTHKEGFDTSFKGIFRVAGADILDLGAGRILDKL
jgi:hypothetical protein